MTASQVTAPTNRPIFWWARLRSPALGAVRLPPGWGLALWLLVVLRVGLGVVAIFSLHLQSITSLGGELLGLLMHGSGLGTELVSPWQRYDALWYQQIAQHGYHAGDNTVHFQPLFPLLSRIVAYPLLGNIVPAELAVASVAFVVAMWLLFRVAELDVGDRAASLAVLLTAFFPVGFFLVAPYTESLYLALSLAAFWLARQGRPWLAGLAGFGAGLTRTVAFFLVLPLAFEYLRQRDEEGKRPGLGLLAATLPVVALLAMVVFQREIVGDQRSIFLIGQHFGDRGVPPWVALPDSWRHIAATGDPVEIMNLLSLAVFTLLSFLALRRLPLAYGLYSLPYLALLFCRESEVSPLESVARYLLVLFPCFILASSWLARRPGAALSCLAVSLCLQVVFFAFWVHFGFVA